ncbi:MAG: tetratricopeptide repeat protein [Pyrinomonadaceae bacterium]
MPRTVKLSLLALTLFLTVFTPMGVAQRSDPRVADFARELVRSDSTAKRSELLTAKRELVTTELGRELVRQGNFLLLAGKYSAAFDLYSLAESVSSQINDTQGLASASLNIGTVYYLQGNYAPALDHYRRARRLFTSAGNQAEAAKALSGVALILKEQRKDAEALEVFAQALKEFESLDDKEEMANTLSSMGAIHYARGDYAAASKAFLRSKELNGGTENVLHMADAFYMQGDYAQASDYYQLSLESFEQERNAAGLISALGGAANSNYYQGKYDEALDYYRRNVTIQEQQRDESGVATSLQGIGNVYRSRGDLSSALASYLRSLAVAEHSEVKVSTAATLGNIGLVRAMQGDHLLAADYFKESLAQFEATGDNVGMARMLGHLGNAYYAGGNYESALESYRKSLTLRESLDDKAGQASLLVGIGTVFMAQKNYPQALDTYQKALRLYDSVTNKEASAYVLTRIADTYLLQGDYPQTLAFAERAYALAKEVESASTSWYARLVYGKAQRALKQPAQASQAFGEASAIVESLRAQPATGEPGDGRSSLLPYLAQVELLIDQNKLLEAFDYAERAKGQALSELLRRSNAKIARDMSDVEQAQERKLTGEVVSLNLQLDRQAQSKTYDEVRQTSLRNRLRQARSAYVEFRKRLFANHPGLRLARGELPPLKLEETRALIADKQTALLEFVITEDDAYLFVLTLDKVSSNAQGPRQISAVGVRSGAARVRPMPIEPVINLKVYALSIRTSDLVDRIAQFQHLLANRDEAFRPSARELYDLLLKPADEQLAGKTRLIIVPDGILWRVPFAALQPGDDRYLIEQAAVSYAPSLCALREMRKPHNQQNFRGRNAKGLAPPVTLAAFGNPLLSTDHLMRLQAGRVADRRERITTSDGPKPGQAAELDRKQALEPALEQALEQDREIQRLRAVYGSANTRVFAGVGASEQNARIEAIRPNVVLHFAVPAVLDDAIPMYSFTGLSAVSGKQAPEVDDGLLHTWELMNLSSQARLVVLSAAEMEDGRVGPGDAVAALMWSWFVAGTPAVALTRWPVRSPALSQFVSDFHAVTKAVAKPGFPIGSLTQSKTRFNPPGSISKAEAMRQSMLTLRRSKDYQHPYYWSAFILIGDAR